jgi:hypothetical protein
MTFSPIANLQSLKGKKLLFADDLEGNRVLGTLFLQFAGVQVVTVADGAEAVKKALEQTFDIILMDIHMPVLNGLEAIKRLRSEGVRSPIVVVSSDSRGGIRERAFEIGANSFIPKPLTLQNVLQTLSHLFSRPQSC